MTIRYLITVFVVFLFCVPVSAEETCRAKEVLVKSGFSQGVAEAVCDIQSKQYHVSIQVFSDNRSMMVEVHPNGQIMMFLLNKKGEYVPFAATQ